MSGFAELHFELLANRPRPFSHSDLCPCICTTAVMFEHQRTVNKLGLCHIVSLETEQGSNILMRGNIRLSDISYYRSNSRDSVSVRNNKAKC